MATTTISQMRNEPEHLPTKRQRKPSRKALARKTPSTSEANIAAGINSAPSPSPIPPTESQQHLAKENHESLSQPRSAKKATKKVQKQAKEAKVSSFEKDLEEMQEKLEQLKLEKERTDVMLKEKDAMLKIKEEELEIRGKEQEKLQVELKKMQKLKEFKPTMTFPIVQSLRDKELDKKDKKKKCCPEKKRPSTPYILWCKDQWKEIKKDNVEGDFKEMSIILGAKWKNISAEEKKPYEEKYHAEREAYLKIVGKEKREIEAITLLEDEQKQKTAMELLEQYLQFRAETEKDNKKSKKAKDPLKPKHPLSAFLVFSSERRPTWLAENKSFVEISKFAGEEWKTMTDKQKRPYEEIAKKNKERYQQEMEIYNQKKDEEATTLKMEEDEKMKIHKQEALQLLKKKDKTDNIIKKMKENRQKKKKQNDPNKPKKPASSFLLFSNETRKSLQEERQGLNNSSVTALISVKWKELSEQEKQIWNEKAAVAMDAYKKDLEEYNKSVAAIDAEKTQN